MFSLNETSKFMVYSTSVDLRKGVEPLCGLARICGRKPSDGSVYVYFNRSRTLMKLLHWERGGYVIYYKRMEVGRISRKVFQAHHPRTQELAVPSARPSLVSWLLSS